MAKTARRSSVLKEKAVKSQSTLKTQKMSKASKTAKQTIGKEKQTRVQILRSLAETTGFSKTEVVSLFSALTEMMIAHLGKKGSGEFIIPMTGIKVRRVKKKASKARKMVSHLTGQEVFVPAKPARNVVKISALKVLRSAVAE